jgi:hypothetical protein
LRRHIKDAEHKNILTVASELSIHICSCAVSLYYARQNVLQSEWALQAEAYTRPLLSST